MRKSYPDMFPSERERKLIDVQYGRMLLALKAPNDDERDQHMDYACRAAFLRGRLAQRIHQH
jgi:hypothetical protein